MRKDDVFSQQVASHATTSQWQRGRQGRHAAGASAPGTAPAPHARTPARPAPIRTQRSSRQWGPYATWGMQQAAKGKVGGARFGNIRRADEYEPSEPALLQPVGRVHRMPGGSYGGAPEAGVWAGQGEQWADKQGRRFVVVEARPDDRMQPQRFNSMGMRQAQEVEQPGLASADRPPHPGLRPYTVRGLEQGGQDWHDEPELSAAQQHVSQQQVHGQMPGQHAAGGVDEFGVSLDLAAEDFEGGTEYDARYPAEEPPAVWAQQEPDVEGGGRACCVELIFKETAMAHGTDYDVQAAVHGRMMACGVGVPALQRSRCQKRTSMHPTSW